jgi:hypothetical protein
MSKLAHAEGGGGGGNYCSGNSSEEDTPSLIELRGVDYRDMNLTISGDSIINKVREYATNHTTHTCIQRCRNLAAWWVQGGGADVTEVPRTIEIDGSTSW